MAIARTARRKADTAIPGEDCRDALARRWRDMFRPCDLRVVMRVQIDEARHDDKTSRIDLLGTPFRNLADFYNAIASNGDISDDRRTSRSVDNGAAANHDARILT